MIQKVYRALVFQLVIGLITIFSIINLLLIYINFPSSLPETKTIILPKGITLDKVVSTLEEENIIMLPDVFKLFIKVYQLKYPIKSGEYLFTPGVTPLKVLRTLTSGKSVIRKMVIFEGSPVKAIIDKLNEEPRLIGEIQENIPEGYLFPDTYFYSFGDSREILIDRMRNNMSSLLDKLMPELDVNSPIKTRLDVLKLASIVEAETMLDSEKPRIAAVYLNRLNKGMKLQADPTVIYAITSGKVKLDRLLTRNDLLIDSPYNTYRIYGLPPTAIGCPGRKSVEAVIKPMKTNELFFVANGRGGHNFATNLKDHLANVLKYKQTLRNAPNHIVLDTPPGNDKKLAK